MNLIICVGVAVMVGILVAFVGYRAYDELLEIGSRAQYNELGGRSQTILSRYESVQQSGEDLRERILTLMEQPTEMRSRAAVEAMLRDTVLANDYLVGAGVVFEPDVLDGQDAAYAGNPLSDASGRMMSYASRVGSDVAYEPATGFEHKTWYVAPKSTKKPVVTEPYLEPIAGKDTMIVSVGVPIIENGQFILDCARFLCLAGAGRFRQDQYAGQYLHFG